MAAKLDFTACVKGGEEIRKEEQARPRDCYIDQLRPLLRERAALQRELEEKKERLRKLKMVKMYQSKVTSLTCQDCLIDNIHFDRVNRMLNPVL